MKMMRENKKKKKTKKHLMCLVKISHKKIEDNN